MCFALKNFLENNELTSEQFADMVPCSRVSVSRYVSGGRIPTKKIMKKIVQVTNWAVTPNDFYELPAVDAGSRPSIVGSNNLPYGLSIAGCQGVSISENASGRRGSRDVPGVGEGSVELRQIELFHARASS